MLNNFMDWFKSHRREGNRDSNPGAKYGISPSEFNKLSPYMQSFIQRDSFEGNTTGRPEASISQIERGADGRPTLGKQGGNQKSDQPYFAPLPEDKNSAGIGAFLDMLKSFVMK